MRAWSSLAALGVALFAVSVMTSCQNLEPIEQGCGNQVVEPGEDCDGTFASVESGAACGDPGTENACRFTCSAENPICPTGFRCDREDDVCRKPRGLFEAAGAAVSGSTEPLIAADLDQNGASELIATSPSSLSTFFFDDDLQVEQVQTVAVRSRDEAVGAVRPTGRQDLALLLDGSDDVPGYLALLESKTDGSFEPIPFSSLSAGFAGITGATRLETVDVWFGETVVRVGPNGIGVLDENFSPQPLYDGAILQQVPGEIAGIDFGNPVPQSNPCEFAVIAKEGASHVLLLPLCEFFGGGFGFDLNVDGNATDLIPIELPPGAVVAPASKAENATVQSRVRFAKLNLDDIDDLLVQGRCNVGLPEEANCLLEAFGTGDRGPSGFFFEHPSEQPDPMNPTGPPVDLPPNHLARLFDEVLFPCDATSDALQGFVLEVADFNGDSQPDMVTNRGLYLSVGSTPGGFEPLGRRGIVYDQVLCAGDPLGQDGDGSGFREVEVEDLNDDDEPDFVVRETRMGGAEGSLTAYLNDGDGFFGLYSLADRASFFEVEDVDGDGLDDVVSFSRASPMSTSYRGQVAYGRTSAGPEPALSLGEFDGVVDLISGRFAGNDAPNDVLVLQDSNDEVSGSILFGSTSRLLVAPFLLLDEGVSDPRFADRPLSLAMGRFGGELDSIAIIAEPDEEVLELDPDGDDFEYAVWRVQLDGDGTPTAQKASVGVPLFLDDGLAVSLEITGDDSDELLVATTEGFAAIGLADQGFELIDSWTYPDDVVVEVNRLTGRPLTRDLDGDGRDDLVIALGSSVALVLWNDPNAISPSGNALFVPIPGSDTGLGSQPVFAALDLNGTGPDDLVVASNAGVWWVPLAGRSNGAPQKLDGIEGGNTLAAADFDGDGLTDLAVGDASTTRLYRAVDSPGFEVAAPAETPSIEP